MVSCHYPQELQMGDTSDISRRLRRRGAMGDREEPETDRGEPETESPTSLPPPQTSFFLFCFWLFRWGSPSVDVSCVETKPSISLTVESCKRRKNHSVWEVPWVGRTLISPRRVSSPPKASFPTLRGWVLFIPLAHNEMSGTHGQGEVGPDEG